MNNEYVIKVVLADDHAVVRSGIKQFLESSELIQVIGEADDGKIALDLVQRLNPDVVVLDIQMPEATGIEVTRELRKLESKVGILILTAYDDDSVMGLAIADGDITTIGTISMQLDSLITTHNRSQGVDDAAVLENAFVPHANGSANFPDIVITAA